MLKKILSVLIAVLISSPCMAGNSFHVRTSSFKVDTGGAVFSARVITDGDISTGWIEGAESNGVGQWIHFFFPGKVIVDSVVVRNGIGRGADYEKVNRIKEVVAAFSDGQRQNLLFADTGNNQTLPVAGYPTTSLGFNIRSVYSDGRSSDAGFAEIAIQYHRPLPDEIPVYEQKASRGESGAPSKEGDSVTVVKKRPLSSQEKEILYKKMGELEKKKLVLNELKQFFDKFYSRFVTMNVEYPRMWAESEFLRESAAFESFRAMLEKRGVLQKYEEAVVSTSGLKLVIRTLTPSDIELWVKGTYTVIFDMRTNDVPENSLYRLKKEYGEWKVKSKLEY